MQPDDDQIINSPDLLEQGRRLAQSGNYTKAVELFDLAIDQNKELAEAYFIRGACYYVLGYYRRATDDLNAATLFGCRDAQLWSKFETNRFDEDEDEDEDVDGG